MSGLKLEFMEGGGGGCGSRVARDERVIVAELHGWHR